MVGYTIKRNWERGGHHLRDHHISTSWYLDISWIAISELPKYTKPDSRWLGTFPWFPDFLVESIFTISGFWFHISHLSLPKDKDKRNFIQFFSFALFYFIFAWGRKGEGWREEKRKGRGGRAPLLCFLKCFFWILHFSQGVGGQVPHGFSTWLPVFGLFKASLILAE